jgi:release factor glutamine methyltransferase
LPVPRNDRSVVATRVRLLDEAAARLSAAGVSSPRVDAELLLADVLGLPRSHVVLARPDSAAAERFSVLVERRAARVPLQHLTGTSPFRHLELAVGPGVFIPRPETELLVDAVLPALHRGSVVVDLGAGSGALALAVAQESPGTLVHAVENSPSALIWLRRNAAGTGVHVVAGDVRDPDLLAGLHGRVDAVVCNPPYVPEHTRVDPEVRADPAEAVFAGADGLDLMPAVLARAGDLLRTGGLLALEHDDTHCATVPLMLRADGRWTDVREHRDLAGRPRYATARRLGPHS